MIERRNVLAMLGLAPIATAALSTDDFVKAEHPGPQIAKYDPEKLAKALERLAGELRKGGVNISRFEINSSVGQADEWLTQQLLIDLEIYHTV